LLVEENLCSVVKPFYICPGEVATGKRSRQICLKALAEWESQTTLVF